MHDDYCFNALLSYYDLRIHAFVLYDKLIGGEILDQYYVALNGDVQPYLKLSGSLL